MIFFVNFELKAIFGAFRATNMKLKLERQLYLAYLRWKFQFHISYTFWRKIQTTNPSKNKKNCDFSKPEMTSSKQKKVLQIYMIYYKSWIFHGNRSKRFREIGCTKSVRKIIKIDPIRSLNQWASPFFSISKERSLILNIFCSTCVQKFSIVFEILRKEYFRGHSVTPLWGRLAKKWKLHIVESMILNNFCSIMLFKMFVVFVIYEVKDLSFWPLKSLIT